MNYFDAHLHWFKDSAFGDRLAGALGGRPDIGYYEDKYRARGRLAGGIVMGNGPLEDQGRGLPEGFFYCLGLDESDCVDHIGAFLPEIERHLESDRCVGLKIYPGYMPLFPHSPKMYGLYERLCSCGKVLAVHTGMMASLGGKLKYAHPIHLDDVAVDFPELKIVMCHFGNPFLPEAAAVMEHNKNVYADLSGLIEGPFRTEEFMEREKAYTDLLKLWIRYVGDCKRFMFGTDWPAVDCVEYGRFIVGLFREDEAEHVMFRNALEIYNIKEYFADERPESK